MILLMSGISCSSARLVPLWYHIAPYFRGLGPLKYPLEPRADSDAASPAVSAHPVVPVELLRVTASAVPVTRLRFVRHYPSPSSAPGRRGSRRRAWPGRARTCTSTSGTRCSCRADGRPAAAVAVAWLATGSGSPRLLPCTEHSGSQGCRSHSAYRVLGRRRRER